MVTAPGRAIYPRTFHPDVTDESQAKVVQLNEGEEVTGVDIAIGEAKKTYEVIGRILDADSGQPVINVQVMHAAFMPGSTRIRYTATLGTRSNVRGEFHLQNVLPGKYAAFVQPDETSEYYSETTPFEVNDGNVTGVEIRVRRGGSISGVVVVEGSNDPGIYSKLQQIGLVAYSRENLPGIPMRGMNRIKPDGSFRINGVRPGKTEISITSFQEMRGFSLLRVERDGATHPEGIEVGPGEQIGNVRVVVAYGTAVLRGQLKIIGATLPEGTSSYVSIRALSPQISSGGCERSVCI